MPRRAWKALGALLASCLGVAAAGAEPATSEGAKAIERAYAEYVSQAAIDKGVVEVTPQGEAYVVTLDLAKAIAAAGGPADVVNISPLVYRLTPTLGGGWIADASSFPTLAFGSTGEDKREGGQVAFTGFRFDSLFDPAAPYFWRAKLGLGALALDLKQRVGDDLQHLKISENNILGEMQIKAGDDKDSVDVSLTQTIESSSQQTESAEGGDAQATDIKQGSASGDSQLTSFRAAAFGDLWRFLVAHAGAGAPAPAPEEMRAKLEALLPVWRRFASRFTLEDVDFPFPGGGVTIKTVAQEAKMSGLAADASAEFAFGVQNVAVAFEGAPEWAKAAWPASLQFRIAAGVSGLDRAAHLALDDAEFAKSGNLADETKDQIVRMLRQGHPHVTISETRLSTPLVQATLEGVAQLGDDGAEAHAKVTADDLDKVLGLLATAGESEPEAQQMLFVATFIKGLAKQEDGRLVWNIEIAEPNVLIVNGQRLGSD